MEDYIKDIPVLTQVSFISILSCLDDIKLTPRQKRLLAEQMGQSEQVILNLLQTATICSKEISRKTNAAFEAVQHLSLESDDG